ncbi:Uma2 family endonuclease [Kitasatospora purpeofusca]|uniref:Uma2 family endonuclease n=1 Tax=Kitasatospora purpeofusca TaxID=67352 RepID=UPI00324C8333
MKAAPGRLRDTAEEIARSTGLRVQIIGGTLIAAPPPCGKHAGTVRRLRLRLDRRLPAGLAGYQVSSVGTPDDDEDYATPDLVVLPTGWEGSDEWLADPRDAALAVEVVSRTERAGGTTPGAGWYAGAGVAALLAVDPRKGVWTYFTHPRDGAYRGVLHGRYGEPVPLTAPFTGELPTLDLPLYAPRR